MKEKEGAVNTSFGGSSKPATTHIPCGDTKEHAMKTQATATITTPSLLELAQSLPPESVLQPRIDPLVAKRACATGLEYLEHFAPVLAKKYPGIDLAELQLLPALCDEYGTAQRAVGAEGSLTTAESRALVELAFEWRRKLMPIAESLAISQGVSAQAVAKIRAGYGTSDNIRDVIDLAAILGPHHVAIDALLGPKSLPVAEAAAKTALAAMGSVTRSTAQSRSATDLRDRLGTLIVRGHDRLRTVVALVSTYRQGAEIVRPLTTSTRKGKTAVSPEDPVEPTAIEEAS